jgi:hypothetical protein
LEVYPCVVWLGFGRKGGLIPCCSVVCLGCDPKKSVMQYSLKMILQLHDVSVSNAEIDLLLPLQI